MNLDELNRDQKLRRGLTTGSCAAAAAVCAYSRLEGKRLESVPVSLPGELVIDIPVESCRENASSASATIIKDAGDDPDVTDKCQVVVKAEFCTEKDIASKDYLEPCGKSSLIVRGGTGVGLCTKKGLDVTPGKYAVNPAPRRHIAVNLEKAGFGKEEGRFLLIEISIPGGEKIATRTLNPKLGIEGGISILGVSGIVEPYSNEAYIHSIRLQIRSLAASGINSIALSTGTRSQKAFLRDHPEFPPEACVRIGDFIADTVRAAKESAVSSVNIACMPGKLYKYACGDEYTHAHKTKLNPALMADILTREGMDKDSLQKILNATTVREAVSTLGEETYERLLRKLSSMALKNMGEWNPDASLFLHVYDTEGEKLLLDSLERKS